MATGMAQDIPQSRRDFVAKALFIGNSANADPARTWDELVVMPQHRMTVAWYRKQATIAITAMLLWEETERKT